MVRRKRENVSMATRFRCHQADKRLLVIAQLPSASPPRLPRGTSSAMIHCKAVAPALAAGCTRIPNPPARRRRFPRWRWEWNWPGAPEFPQAYLTSVSQWFGRRYRRRATSNPLVRATARHRLDGDWPCRTRNNAPKTLKKCRWSWAVRAVYRLLTMPI